MDDFAKELVRNKIRQIRTASGLSQKEFADQMHVSQNTINRFEKGHRLPDLPFLARLRELFGSDLNWLVSEENEVGIAPDMLPNLLPVYDEEQLSRPEDKRCHHKHIAFPGIEEGSFAFRIRDDAMAPIIRMGDFVVVQNVKPGLGDMLLCRNKTGIVRARRMSRCDNKDMLTPENPDFLPEAISEELQILGRIARVIRVLEF